MLFYLFSLLVGCVCFVTDQPLRVANLLGQDAFSAFGFSVKEDKAVFYCFFFQKRKVRAALLESGVTIESARLLGLPGFFYRYRVRVGAILGVCVAVALTILSGEFIWQIEVVGNSRMTDEEVLAVLEAEGVYEGAYVGHIDPLAVANRCVMASDSISWMSVNIVGNCVEAVVVEYSDKEIDEKNKVPSNVVALKSGIVRRIEMESGVAEVKEGSVVSEGQLLISGVNLLRDESYIYQPAKGKIYAETLNEITVEKEVFAQKKVYTGEVISETTYIFFTKSKKFSEDSGNLPLTCDRIETKERVMLFGKIPLPIWTVRVEYRAFEWESVTLSEEEAKAAALSEAWRQVAEGELVSVEESYSFDGKTARVTLRYRVIEDIAKTLTLFETP